MAYPAPKGMTDIFAHGDVDETAEAKIIFPLGWMMVEDGVKCFVVMAADTPLRERVEQAVRAISPRSAPTKWKTWSSMPVGC